VLRNARLSETAHNVISDPSNDILFSVASAWELTIKTALGRLQLLENLSDMLPLELADNKMRVLPILLPHVLAVLDLPNHHKDPFDRMLVAQARVEGVPIISADPGIARYDVERIW
jgi:PIN domain nuclease of toxin-antitoxin system